MKARILVIEDEMSINDLLCMNLEIAGYETVGYLDGNEAYEAIIQDHAFQCALVDIMLPGRDGYSLLPKLKQYEIPVIFLTAKGDIASKIKGLKDGAEDYIVKPFSYNLLIKRIEAVLRRSKEDKAGVYLTFEKIKLNLKTYSAEIDGKIIDLTLKEFNILKSLIENYPQVVTREKLLDSIWGYDYFGDTRIVDAHIKNIRKKIILPYIKTVKGIGYTLQKDI